MHAVHMKDVDSKCAFASQAEIERRVHERVDKERDLYEEEVERAVPI